MRHNLEQALLPESTMYNFVCSWHYLPIISFIRFNAGVGEAEIIDIVFCVAFRQGPLDTAIIGDTKVICFVYEVTVQLVYILVAVPIAVPIFGGTDYF